MIVLILLALLGWLVHPIFFLVLLVVVVARLALSA